MVSFLDLIRNWCNLTILTEKAMDFSIKTFSLICNPPSWKIYKWSQTLRKNNYSLFISEATSLFILHSENPVPQWMMKDEYCIMNNTTKNPVDYSTGFSVGGRGGLEGVLCKPTCWGLSWSSVVLSTPKSTFRRPHLCKVRLQILLPATLLSDGNTIVHHCSNFVSGISFKPIAL